MINISVIIPCYNCSAWIHKSMDALEKQTFKDFEVICVDDCSSDDTFEMLHKIKKEVSFDLVILKNDKNFGPALSRNEGIKHARGTYLAFCDSDDWYEKAFLEETYNVLIKNNADLVMCEYKKVFDSGKKTTEVRYLKECSNNREDLLAFSKASMCLLVFKKSITKEIEIPDLRNGEDIAYVPCIESRAKSIIALNKPLYNYRMREGSASKKPTPDIYKSLIEAYAYIENNFEAEQLIVLEYIGIKTIVYGAVINALKGNVSRMIVLDIIDTFEKKYPNWNSNKYLFLFSKPKRFFLKAISKKYVFVCWFLAKLHRFLSV